MNTRTSRSNSIRTALVGIVLAASALSLAGCGVNFAVGDEAREQIDEKASGDVPFELAEGTIVFSDTDDDSGELQVQTGKDGLQEQKELLEADGYDISEHTDGRLTATKQDITIEAWMDGYTIHYDYEIS